MTQLMRNLLVCLVALATGLQAQTMGRLVGTVTDQTGAAVAGAQIVVRSNRTGQEWKTNSDSIGDFSIPLLPPGVYKVAVAANGFQQKVLDGVAVNVTETTTIQVPLSVGAARETIIVSANAPFVQRDGPELGRVVNARGVSELPLATRNFTQILSLSPGTATYLPDSTGVGRNTQAISVNGARVTQNNYQINGVDVNTLGTNGPILVPVPAPEAIEEFKVQTSLYDATYGRAGGANIQILTRSGGNQLHGSAYEFLRNDALNANDSFLKAAGVKRPALRRNVFGATLGGPVRQSRAFFFISYQRSRETNGASLINSISSNVLVAPGLTDDRSQATLLSIFHPTLANGQSATAIDPAALALLNTRLPNGAFLIPTPGPNGRFTASTSSFFQEDQFNTNFDYILGAHDTLAAKFFFSNVSQELALPSFRGTGSNVPGFGSDAIFNNRLLTLQHIHTFSSSLVNETRLGYALNRNNTFPHEPVSDSQIGIARANAAQYPGLPLIRIAQPAGGIIFGTGPQVDSLAAPSTTTLNDTISMVRGRHTVRTGGEVRYNLINFKMTSFSRGQIDFLDFNNFLVGNTRTSTIGAGIADRAWRTFDYNFFAQDDWKLAPWLTLDFGVRYELDLPVYDSRGRLATFDPELYQPRMQVNSAGPIGPPVGGLIQAGNAIQQFELPDLPNGQDSLLRSVDPYNLAPRLGFAASPTKRIVVRGGYGLFYSRPTFQYSSVAATLPPFYVLGMRNNAPLSDPFAPLPPSSQFPTLVPGVPLAGIAFDRNQRVPYFHQFNLTTQYQLSENWMVETGYVGSRGRRLFRQVAINQALLASLQTPIINVVTGTAITTNTADNAQLRAPFQGVSENGFFMNESDGESSYDSLQVSLVRRFARRLQLLGSYTWAKSIDDSSGAGGGAGVTGIVNTGAVGDSSSVLGDQFERRANRGLSDFNRTHRLVVSYVWDLPTLWFAQESFATRHIFSNWRVSGILTVMSGLPVDIVDTGSGSFYGLANGSNPLARPSFTAGATCETAKRNVPSGYLFNPFAFNLPVVLAGQPIPSSNSTAVAGARGTDIGNVPRNCIIGPSQSTLDFAVAKTFRLREQRVVEFRTEFFNLFNHANLANPISNLNAIGPSGGTIDPNTGRVLQLGNFGRIISTSANPRLIQFAVRASF